jgi:phosphatidate cytidylyltransferase
MGLLVAGAVVGLVALDATSSSTLATSTLIVFLGVAALHELYGMLRDAGLRVHRRLGLAACVTVLFVRAAAEPLGLSPGEAREVSLALLGFAVVAPFAVGIVRPPQAGRPGRADVDRASATVHPLVYVTLLTSFLLELRLLPGPGEFGLSLCFVLALSVKVGDTCAYFVGRTIGRHPMCWVSPKKTWEGAFASIIGSVGVAALAAPMLGQNLVLMAGFGLVSGLAGQGGDLVESYLKRALDVKDSARTFGEMGGALDMVDALLLAAPAGYVWARLLLTP